MSETFSLWLCRSALAGGGLLLLGWLIARRLTDPDRQQRLAEWSVAAALLAALLAVWPAWVVIPVPTSVQVPTSPELVEPMAPLLLPPLSEPVGPLFPAEPAPTGGTGETQTSAQFGWPAWTWSDGLLVGYMSVAGLLLARWLLASIALARLLAQTRPAPQHLQQLLAQMAGSLRCQLLVCDRVRVPFSVGLFRRIIVLPSPLVERGDRTEWRMVLAHELTHLVRQDTRTWWLFAVAEVVFFYLPWFWWLRRQARLCQEYVADAQAAHWAAHPADYAQFLLSWASPSPVGATGVSGSGSDLYRRVTMLLRTTKSSSHQNRRWLMATIGGMLALAVLAGSLSVQAVLAAPDEKPAAPKAPAKPKAPLAPIPPLGNGAEWEDLFQPFDQLENLPEQFREQMKQLREQMKQMRQQFQQQGGGLQFQFDPLGGFGRPAVGNRQQRLGVQIRVPSSTLIEQLDLPAGQGIVIEEVGPNSAAAKAGIKPHDVLIELDGKPVSNNPAELRQQVAQIKANTPVDAVVLRKGRKETIKGLTLPEAKADTAVAPRPLFGQFPGNLNFGGGFGGVGQSGSTSIQRQNDDFTALHSYNDVKLTVKGTIDQGKAVIQEVVVEKAGQKTTYTDVEKVPAEYRGKVKKLAEMSATGKLVMPIGD